MPIGSRAGPKANDARPEVALHPMLIASVEHMVTDARYRQLADGGWRMADGAVVPSTTSSDMTGSIMGKSGQLRTSITYIDVQRAR